MHPRKRLDLGWADLATAGARCAFDGEARARRILEARLGPRWLATLSVRSALDLALLARGWPRGTRVLVSALTIPDMVRVLEAHGLAVQPLDVDPRTLEPDLAQAAALLAANAAEGARSGALLLAHLYGTRIALDRWHALAEEHGVELWEDGAQAWTGDEWRGDERSDLVFLSFGPIKTGTALAGGLVRAKDDTLLGAMRGLQRQWPAQSRGAYAARVSKYAGFKLVATRAWFGLFDRLCRWRGTSSDEVIAGSVRGFPRDELLHALRRRPCGALLATLARRLAQGERSRVRRQRELGEVLRARLEGRVELVGGAARVRHHWVAVVEADDPAALVAALRACGYDATARATLACIGDARRTPRAHAAAARFVYLPLHAEMGEAALLRLADALAAALADQPARRAKARSARLAPGA